MKRALSLIACALIFGTTFAAAAQTTIVGTWRWTGGGPAVFAPDGTVRRNGQNGLWERRGTTYVVTWLDAKPGMENEIDSVETLTMSSDGTALHGRAQDGRAVSAALLSRAQVAVAAPPANRSAVAYAPRVVARSRPAPRALSEYTSGGALDTVSQTAATARRPAASQSATPATTQSTQSVPASGQTAAAATTASTTYAPPAPVYTPTIYITAPGNAPLTAPAGGMTHSATAASAPQAVPTVFTPAYQVGNIVVAPSLLIFSGPNQSQQITVSQVGFNQPGNGFNYPNCGGFAGGPSFKEITIVASGGGPYTEYFSVTSPTTMATGTAPGYRSGGQFVCQFSSQPLGGKGTYTATLQIAYQ